MILGMTKLLSGHQTEVLQLFPADATLQWYNAFITNSFFIFKLLDNLF